MLKSTRWIVFLIMVLGMASLACQTLMGPGENEANAANNTETAANEVTTENSATTDDAAATNSTNDTTAETPTDTSSTEETTTEEATTGSAGQDFNFRRANTALNDISSYRAVITISGGSGNDSGETFNMEMEMLVTTNPPASSLSFTGLDFGLGQEGLDLGGLGAMTVVQVDGKTYTNLPGLGCTTSETTDETMTEGMITRPDQMFDDLNSEGVTLVEEGVVINGISTDHYHFDETAIQDADASFSSLTGDIYVAREGQFIVRFVIDGQGNVGGFGDEAAADLGTFHMEFNVFDVNSNITVTAPADCTTIGGDSGSGDGNSGSGDYPMLADAFELTTFAGIITYKTNTSIADAAAFYRDELTAQGWSVSFDYSDDTTALLTLDKDGATLTVTVTTDPASGANLVSLIET